MNIYLGFDGGGTKTECIALDADGRIAGHGNSGPSNPLRVGYDAACAALQLAAAAAVTSAKSAASDVRGVCAGLAGAGRRNVAEEMRVRLARIWPGAPIQIVTDAEAALETAVGNAPGVVLIAGTGSIALGRNAKGELARAGGYGTWIGDAGSAYDIGRQAALAVARARDLAAPATILTEMILTALDCGAWDDVVEKACRWSRLRISETCAGGDASCRRRRFRGAPHSHPRRSRSGEYRAGGNRPPEHERRGISHRSRRWRLRPQLHSR